jgi:hypothetical protein
MQLVVTSIWTLCMLKGYLPLSYLKLMLVIQHGGNVLSRGRTPSQLKAGRSCLFGALYDTTQHSFFSFGTVRNLNRTHTLIASLSGDPSGDHCTFYSRGLPTPYCLPRCYILSPETCSKDSLEPYCYPPQATIM